MLVPYTHTSSLSQEQKQRLKAFLAGRVLEGHAFVQFEGMTLSIGEVRSLQRVWEAETPRTRQVLLG